MDGRSGSGDVGHESLWTCKVNFPAMEASFFALALAALDLFLGDSEHEGSSAATLDADDDEEDGYEVGDHGDDGN